MNDRDMYLLYSEQFRRIDDNLNELSKQAEDYSQQLQIIRAWQEANLSYLKSMNLLFAKFQESIKQLADDFQQAAESSKDALDRLKQGPMSIRTVIDKISDGVDKGKQLLDWVEELNKGKGKETFPILSKVDGKTFLLKFASGSQTEKKAQTKKTMKKIKK